MKNLKNIHIDNIENISTWNNIYTTSEKIKKIYLYIIKNKLLKPEYLIYKRSINHCINKFQSENIINSWVNISILNYSKILNSCLNCKRKDCKQSF